MACDLNRENVTISIIQYASDKLEDTGLFINTGGNTLEPSSPTPFKKSVDLVFKYNKELSSIGSLEQYSAYLDTVFPDSKVKDILYHGGPNKIESFQTKGSSVREWNYFTDRVSRAEEYGEVTFVAIDSKFTGEHDFTEVEGHFGQVLDDDTAYFVESSGDEYVVRNSEQIHILGDKADLENFREFTKVTVTPEQAIDNLNQEFNGNPIAILDEEENKVTIWPDDDIVDGYLPIPELSQEQLQAVQDINEEVGEEVLTVDENNNVVIKETELPQDLDFTPTDRQAQPKMTPEAKTWVKSFLDRVGVKVQSLNDIVINGERMGADAVALPLQALVLHTQDGEVSLTEEAMHIAVELVSQKNKSLFDEMMDSIESTDTYKEVFEQYSTDPEYQDEDGSPNTTKIKKEAVGKLLAQVTIAKKENSRFRNLWDQVLDFFKGLFGNSGDNLVTFYKATDALLQEDLGTIRDTLLQNYGYLQDNGISHDNAQEIIALAQSDITDEELRIGISNLVPVLVFKNKLGAQGDRVDNILKKNLASQTGNETDGNISATKLNVHVQDQKEVQDRVENKDSSPFHKTIISSINKFLNPEGFLDPTVLASTDLQINLLERMGQYPKDTKFYTSKKIVHKGKIFTIDFMAIQPDGRTSVLQFDEVVIEDPSKDTIPTFETKAYRNVLDATLTALRSLGITKLGMTRSIPVNSSEFSSKHTIIIGDVKVENEDLDYLMPIPSQMEQSGDANRDNFIKSLNNLLNKLTSKTSPESTRLSKISQLSLMARSIREFQVKKDIRPMILQTNLVAQKMESLIKTYDLQIRNLDFSLDKNKSKLSNFASEVSEILQIGDTYQDLGLNLTKVINQGKLKGSSVDLNYASNKVRAQYSALLSITGALMENYAENKLGVSELQVPERTIGFLSRNLRQLSQQSMSTVKALYKMFSLANQKTDIEMSRRVEELSKLKVSYDRWAKSKGITLRDQGKYLMEEGTNELIKKTQDEFYTDLYQAQKDNDKTWFEDNVDLTQYEKDYTVRKDKVFSEINKTIYALDIDRNNELRAREKENFLDTYDISKGISPFNSELKKYPISSKWDTREYKFLEQKGNEPALGLYKAWQSRNNETAEMGVVSPNDARTFVPFVHKSLAEKTLYGGKKRLGEALGRELTIHPEDVDYGQTDEQGNLIDKIPFYYTVDTAEIDKKTGKKDYSGMSRDMFYMLNLYDQQILRYKNYSEIEQYADLLSVVEKNKKALQTDKFGNVIVGAETIDNIQNSKLFDNFLAASLYGHKNIGTDFDMKLGTFTGKLAKRANKLFGAEVFSETYFDRPIPLSKAIDTANRWYQLKVLGLNIPVTISNFFGTNMAAFIQSGKYFRQWDFAKAEFGVMAGKITNNKDIMSIALLDGFMPLMDSENNAIKARQLRFSAINSLTIPEAMMKLMSISDRPVQWAIASAMLENTMFQGGKLVNIREYLKQEMYKTNLYTSGMSEQEREVVEKQFEVDVQNLKDTRSLKHTAKVVDEKVVLIDDNGAEVDWTSEDVLSYREKMQQVARNATGMGNQEDFRLANKTMIGRSAMMFKSWLPRLVDQRFGELREVASTDSFEMGRIRALWNVMSPNIIKASKDVYNILNLNDEGVATLLDRYQVERDKWERNNPGKEFRLSEDEFVDMYSNLIGQQLKEFGVWAVLATALLALFSLGDDDDYDNTLSKGSMSYFIRIMDKVNNELSFFYSPKEWVKLANGNVFPALSIVTDFIKVSDHMSRQVFGYATGDEEMMKKAKPTKFIMKSLPVTKWTTPFMALFLNEANQKDFGFTAQSELEVPQDR